MYYKLERAIDVVKTFFRIRKYKSCYDLNKLVDFAFSDCKSIIDPIQDKFEILNLLEILYKTRPRYILEIGTWMGGGLFLFSRVACEDAIIISMDLPPNPLGGYPKWRIPFYKSFALPGQKIHLIRSDSHNSATLDRVKTIFKDKKIDFLFIDGDHSYKSVKKDFEMYSPLVKENGIIAFHDIQPAPPELSEVNRFWDEIKPKYEYIEIIKDQNSAAFGIGLIKKGKA